MAYYDDITERNLLSKKEKIIQGSVHVILGFTALDILSLLFNASRSYHFDDFPNLHLIGVALLFLLTIARLVQATNEGKDPYMEASREWRDRKGMLGPYDFIGPGPDYSNKFYNILYGAGVCIGIGLMVFELVSN